MSRCLIHKKALVVLETMWGGNGGRAPRFFRINPNNFSGRRLYKLLGHDDFYVTNACPQYVENANRHGTPNPEWLATSLQRLTYDLLLLCGRIAQETYDQCGYTPKCVILRMPHPAARMWTKQMLQEWQERLKKYAS
jgi:hypothetical protein